MEKLFDVYYTKAGGKAYKVRYSCIDKIQARRLFFSEIQKGEELKQIVEVKEQGNHYFILTVQEILKGSED